VITTYSELQSAVASWLHRTDLSAVIPDFITLTEERMNRALRVRQMESALATTAISSNRIAVPANTVGIKTLWVPNYEATPLKAQSYESLVALGTEGTPTAWAWQGDYFYFDGTGSVTGVLYQKIAALSNTNTSNWLLTAAPSAYLFGALAEAAAYVKNMDAAMSYEARFQKALDEISGNNGRDTISGPLVARAR
jgi:hypothetical protein